MYPRLGSVAASPGQAGGGGGGGGGGGSGLMVTISPPSVTTTSIATLRVTGGSMNGPFVPYAILNGIKYQLFPANATLDSTGSVTTTVDLSQSPVLPSGIYTIFVLDAITGNTATGNTFTVQ